TARLISKPFAGPHRAALGERGSRGVELQEPPGAGINALEPNRGGMYTSAPGAVNRRSRMRPRPTSGRGTFSGNFRYRRWKGGDPHGRTEPDRIADLGSVRHVSGYRVPDRKLPPRAANLGEHLEALAGGPDHRGPEHPESLLRIPILLRLPTSPMTRRDF